MSTLRVSNIEAKADASSPTIDEKVKVTSSQGRVLVQIDGKTAGITSIGINTTSTSFTIDGNQNVQFVGVITAANVNTTGVSTFTRLNVGTGGTIVTTTTGGLVGIGTTNPGSTLDVRSSTGTIRAQETVSNYSVLLNPGPTSGPRIVCGSNGDSSFIEFGAYNNSNNIDTKSRDLKIFSTSAPNAFILRQATGNIGIGTTNPGAPLSISGTGGGSYLDIYNGGDIRLFPAGQHTGSAQSVSIYCDTSGEVSVGGTINYTGVIKQSGSNVIQWVELTPGVTEWSWSGAVTSQAITLNPSTIPSTARYVLADVFVTANSSDHQNIVLGRSTLTNEKNWVDARGQQPSGQFGTLTRQAVTLTYNGEGDGYTPNFGMWYSSQHIPCSGRTIYYNNYGWSGSSGWVYVVVKAYSL
jgi:hypothetical protein